MGEVLSWCSICGKASATACFVAVASRCSPVSEALPAVWACAGGAVSAAGDPVLVGNRRLLLAEGVSAAPAEATPRGQWRLAVAAGLVTEGA